MQHEKTLSADAGQADNEDGSIDTRSLTRTSWRWLQLRSWPRCILLYDDRYRARFVGRKGSEGQQRLPRSVATRLDNLDAAGGRGCSKGLFTLDKAVL